MSKFGACACHFGSCHTHGTVADLDRYRKHTSMFYEAPLVKYQPPPTYSRRQSSFFQTVPPYAVQEDFILGKGHSTYGQSYHKSKNRLQDPDPGGIRYNRSHMLMNNHRKKQHFQYGETKGGSPSNALLYGSNRTFALPESYKMATHNPMRRTNYSTQPFTYQEDNYGSTRYVPSVNRSGEKSRRDKEAADRNEFLKQHVNIKSHAKKNEEHEKRQNLEMLRDYKPWGKPGAGAPLGGEESEAQHSYRNNYKNDFTDDHFMQGRPGGGAPLRTDSGRVKAGLTADPQIYFQKRDRHQIHDVLQPDEIKTGKKWKGNMTELEELAHKSREERMKLNQQKVKHWWDEDMGATSYDPFGRSGAGAPLRDSDGKLRTGRTMNLHRTVLGSGKEASAPEGLGLQFGGAGGGAPIYDSNGRVVTNKRQTLVKDNNRSFSKETGHAAGAYHPWGSSGGGAPIRNSRGEIITEVNGKLDHEQNNSRGEAQRSKRNEYLGNLQAQVSEKEKAKQAEKQDLYKPQSHIKNNIWGGYEEINSTHQGRRRSKNTSTSFKRSKNNLPKAVDGATYFAENGSVHFMTEQISEHDGDEDADVSEMMPDRKRIKSTENIAHRISKIGNISARTQTHIRTGSHGIEAEDLDALGENEAENPDAPHEIEDENDDDHVIDSSYMDPPLAAVDLSFSKSVHNQVQHNLTNIQPVNATSETDSFVNKTNQTATFNGRINHSLIRGTPAGRLSIVRRPSNPFSQSLYSSNQKQSNTHVSNQKRSNTRRPSHPPANTQGYQPRAPPARGDNRVRRSVTDVPKQATSTPGNPVKAPMLSNSLKAKLMAHNRMK